MYTPNYYQRLSLYQKVLDQLKRESFLFSSAVNVQIAIADNKFEWLLKESVQSMEAKNDNYNLMRQDWWQKILAHATPKQIKEIIWPTFIRYFQKPYDSNEAEIYETMISLFNKLPLESLEDAFPLFMQFCQQNKLPVACQKLLLIFIERLNSETNIKTIPRILLSLCNNPQINSSLFKCILQQALPECIKKLDPNFIATEIVPKLFKFNLTGDGWILTSNLLLSCLSKITAQTELKKLKKEMELYLYHTQPTSDQEARTLVNQRTALLTPYIALISQLDENTNDSLSEKLLQFLPDNMKETLADHIFTHIISLRLNGTHVNESLFIKIEKIVRAHNEKCLQTMNYKSLYTSHLSTDQLDRFLATENFESKHDSASSHNAESQKFSKLASILTEAHPVEYKTKCLGLILKNIDKYSIPLPDCIELTHILDGEFRKLLINLAQTTLGKIIKYDASSTSLTPTIHEYFALLHSCLAVMTSGEIILNVLPTIKEILKSNNKNLIKACLQPLNLIFSKLTDTNVLDELFEITLALCKEHHIGHELLLILSKKATTQKIVDARVNVSSLLKNKCDNAVEKNYVSILAILSNQMPANNLQLADLPQNRSICPTM